MKRLLLALTLLVSGGLSVFAQGNGNARVLFIGNSYTEVNNLPYLVQQVAQSTHRDIEYQANTPGGCTFNGHCTNQSMQMIQQGGWDFVVLQAQSQEPSFPDGQFQAQTLPYGLQLAAAVYQYNPDGEAMFYMTWGRKDGDSYNAQFFPPLGTYEGMDSLLYLRYMMMKEQGDASVCPVGRVWHYIRHNYPEIELYSGDGSHPSMAGSYAAACSFYTMIFKSTPLDITYTAGLDDNTAQIIRNVANRVVFDSISRWQRGATPADTTTTDTTGTGGTDTTQVSILSSIQAQVNLYPNPANDVINIEVSGAQIQAIEVIDMAGRKVKQPAVATRRISVSDLPKGLYTVRITTGNGVVCRKFVKK